MGKSNTILKNTVFLYFRMIIVLVVSLYTSRIVLKCLGFEDYGIYTIVASIVVFLNFFEQALTNSTYRFIAYEIGNGDIKRLCQTYTMAINAHLILAFSLFFILEFVGTWFLNTKLNIPEVRMPAANWVFQFTLINFFIGIIKTPFNSNIIAHEEMSFFAIAGIIEVGLKLLVVFLLLNINTDKLIVFAALQTTVSLLVLLSFVIFCIKRIPNTKYIRYWNIELIQKFASYSGWSLLVNVSSVTMSQCLAVFFNWFVGVVSNAALGIANQISANVNSFVLNFCQAFNPQIIKSYAAKDYEYFNKLLFSTCKLSFLLMLFISVPAIVNMTFVLDIWLGEYPDNTAIFAIFVILAYLIDSCQNPLMIAIHANGNIKYHQIIVSSIKIFSIPAMYFCLKLGSNAAIALFIFMFQNLLCAIARTIYIPHLIQFDVKKYLSDVILRIILITAISFPLPIWIVFYMGSSLQSFLLSSIVSCIIVTIVGYFFVLNQFEKTILLRIPIVRRIANKVHII